MAEIKGNLSEVDLCNLKQGYHGDGGYLYLRVQNQGKKRTWVLRYISPTSTSKSKKEYKIGDMEGVALSEARWMAKILRGLLEKGIDPADLKTASFSDGKAPFEKTFRDVAVDYIKMKKPEWKKGGKSEETWINSLELHVFPYIGGMPANEIGEEDVLAVLEPIWSIKTTTATRIRERMESIFDYARARKWASKENPARWRGKLEYRLANPAKILARTSKHHYDLPYLQIPTFLKNLERNGSLSSLAVAFVILTAGRSGEIRGICWSEIDFKEKLWIIPKERIKGNAEHRVPLCEEALRILKKVKAHGNAKGLIFKNQMEKELTSTALLKAAKKFSGDKRTTIHGLRTSFTVWAYEEKVATYQAIQEALAHKSYQTKADAAYFRSDLLKQRRKLIEEWEQFCLGVTSQK